jgi:hypothetical protein
MFFYEILRNQKLLSMLAGPCLLKLRQVKRYHGQVYIVMFENVIRNYQQEDHFGKLLLKCNINH